MGSLNGRWCFPFLDHFLFLLQHVPIALRRGSDSAAIGQRCSTVSQPAPQNRHPQHSDCLPDERRRLR